MATNLQKYSTAVADSNRRELFGFSPRHPVEDSLAKNLNKYMILYGIENDQFDDDQVIVMQNIFDSITVPD